MGIETVPTEHMIAGERTLNFSNEDALAHFANGYTSRHKLSAEGKRFNDFPVRTQNNEFVLPYGGTFSDREMKVALELGHIVCDPLPNPTHGPRINGSSIDVTLGHYYFNAGNDNAGGLFNPFSETDTLRYFGTKNPETDYLEAEPWTQAKRKLGRRATQRFGDLDYLEGIPEQTPIILLRPNQRILGHTNEFIGIRPPGTTAMQARSTTGRIGLSACYCAGWGDPGFINRWTMEIHNLNEDEYLPVPVGFRIAQLVFNMTGPVRTEYSQASGNYQATSGADLTTVKQQWRPHHMLPRAYKNEVLPPITVAGLYGDLK